MENQKIRWGIIGLGNIANQFASDLLLLEDAVLTAVASRDNTKANEFAKKYNAAKAYNSYESLFDDAEVDIIYIATPHDSHAELSIRALEKGKHVLCEKPVALSYKDAERMIETSRKYNKFFMEAFWTRFIPAVKDILSNVENGIIGEVNYVKADFAFIGNETGGSRLFDKNRGGGALFDIGVYPLFLSYIILGFPKEIVSKSIFNKNGIDLQTSMILQYGKAQSVLHASIVSESNMKAVIGGTKGRIELNSPWFMADGYSIFINEDKEAIITLPILGKGYAHEIIECQNAVRDNQIESKLWTHQNSLDLSKIVEEVKTKTGLSF
jgi:predicted dehydrogenase